MSEHLAVYRTGLRTVGALVALAGFVGVAGTPATGTAATDTARAGTADRPVQLPADPRQVVLTWDARRADLPRNKDGPTLQVRADGGVAVTDPHGGGRPVEAGLSPPQLADLLHFVVREQDVFGIDQDRLRTADGTPATGGGPYSAVLRVSVDGRAREVRCVDFAGGEGGAEAARLYAIRQRLERLVAWAYAGGDAGVAAAVDAANAQLRRDFPDAPPLRAEDVRSAVQRTDGSAQVVLERRAVASDKNPFSFVYARVEKDSPAGAARVVARADLSAAAAGARVKRPARSLRSTSPSSARSASMSSNERSFVSGTRVAKNHVATTPIAA